MKVNKIPSNKTYLAFILSQLSDLDDIRYRTMTMVGEFVLYYHGKTVGGIDNAVCW